METFIYWQLSSKTMDGIIEFPTGRGLTSDSKKYNLNPKVRDLFREVIDLYRDNRLSSRKFLKFFEDRGILNPNWIVYGKVNLLGALTLVGYGENLYLFKKLGANPAIAPEKGWEPISLALRNYYISKDVIYTLMSFYESKSRNLDYNSDEYKQLRELLNEHFKDEYSIVVDLIIEFLDYNSSMVLSSFYTLDLPDVTDDHGRNFLIYSAIMMDKIALPFFLGTGEFDVNSQDNFGRTPLIYSFITEPKVTYSLHPVHRILLNQRDLELDIRDKYGRTALSYAAELAPLRALELLVRGANPNIVDVRGYTPLHYYLGLGYYGNLHGDASDLREFLVAGANPNIQSKNTGKTPFHILAEHLRSPAYLNFVEVMLEYGGDPTIRDKRGRSVWDILEESTIPEIRDFVKRKK